MYALHAVAALILGISLVSGDLCGQDAFLRGDVDMTAAGPVERITDPAAILAKAMEMEDQSAKDYNQSALDCGARADAASKQIFEALVADEEGHWDVFDKQLDNIKRFGPSYLALQSFNAASAAPAKPGAAG